MCRKVPLTILQGKVSSLKVPVSENGLNGKRLAALCILYFLTRELADNAYSICIDHPRKN